MDDQSLFEGLQSLAETAFPKRCSSCTQVYETLEEYLADTKAYSDPGSQFVQGRNYSGATILRLHRSCRCGASPPSRVRLPPSR